MGIFFYTKPPHITKKEFEEIRRELYRKRLDKKELDTVESYFVTHLEEPEKKENGISEEEIDQGLEVLGSNYDIYKLSSEQIEIIREVMKKHL